MCGKGREFYVRDFIKRHTTTYSPTKPNKNRTLPPPIPQYLTFALLLTLGVPTIVVVLLRAGLVGARPGVPKLLWIVAGVEPRGERGGEDMRGGRFGDGRGEGGAGEREEMLGGGGREQGRF